MRVGPGWCAKRHKVYTSSGECPYVQFAAAAHVISTERFVVGVTNGRERDMSQVSDGKVERTLRAWLLLSCVLCDAWCVLLIGPSSEVPYLPFYRPRGSMDYRWEKEEKPEAKKVLRRCQGLPFPLSQPR